MYFGDSAAAEVQGRRKHSGKGRLTSDF